ncbi:DUF3107 domain-containing protein [Humidisolicoccus flavus]|uniref:DUF3107 domain-containing protein n=1 Tax=Humidisolicoccus flavus TaxID=3111414 RepID=UPI003244D64B
MDIRIGIMHSSRELSFESDATPQEIESQVVAALEKSHLTLSDAKGKRYVVPSNFVAYVEIGSDKSRKIGFVA